MEFVRNAILFIRCYRFLLCLIIHSFAVIRCPIITSSTPSAHTIGEMASHHPSVAYSILLDLMSLSNTNRKSHVAGRMQLFTCFCVQRLVGLLSEIAFDGNVTSAGWQVTLCDPMCVPVAMRRVANYYTPFTFYLTF